MTRAPPQPLPQATLALALAIPNATVNALQICSLVLSIYSTFAVAVFELS